VFATFDQQTGWHRGIDMKSRQTKVKFERRTKWFVNKQLQESLSRRLLVYWCGTWLAIFAIPIVTRLMVSKLPFRVLASELVSDLWFPMVMSLLALPIVFWDSIRFSHRIAGPVKRIGNDMRRLADGEPVFPVKLRANDFCHELAENFNLLLQERSERDSQEVLETSSV
jgi:hypothetical protein